MRRVYPLAAVLTATASALMLTTLSASAQDAPGVPWLDSLDEALSRARAEDKLVFLDVYADWCPPCVMMLQQTFTDPKVVEALTRFVPLKVDADEDAETAGRYYVEALPTLLVLNADGGPIGRAEGFLDASQFVAFLERSEQRLEEVRRLEREAQADPRDLEKAMALVEFYFDSRQPAKAVEWLKRVAPVVAEEGTPAEIKAEVSFQTGLALLMAGSFPEGVQQLESFIAAYPEDAKLDHARSLIEQGRLYDALTRVEREEYAEARGLLAALAEGAANTDLREFAKRQLGVVSLLGEAAPALQVKEWVSASGADLAALTGKVALLEFFEVGCPDSGESHEQIVALRDRYAAEGLVVVSIASSVEVEHSVSDTRNYVKDAEMTHVVGIDLDRRKSFDAFRGQDTPWIVLLDRRGKVRFLNVFEGKPVEERIKALLKEAA